jgi:hypothetical protein
MCSSMIVSDRLPLMLWPSASCASCDRVRPPRLSEPVISQLVPAVAAGRPA